MHNTRHLDNQEKEVQLYLVKTAAPKGTSALSEVKVLTINRPATTYTQLVNHLVLWQKKNYKESLIQANQQIHLTKYNIKTLLTIQHKYYLMQTKQYRCVAVINLSSLKHITNTMCMRIKQIFKSSILPELSLVAFNDFLFFFL